MHRGNISFLGTFFNWPQNSLVSSKHFEDIHLFSSVWVTFFSLPPPAPPPNFYKLIFLCISVTWPLVTAVLTNTEVPTSWLEKKLISCLIILWCRARGMLTALSFMQTKHKCILVSYSLFCLWKLWGKEVKKWHEKYCLTLPARRRN